jgi:hypothetical protein
MTNHYQESKNVKPKDMPNTPLDMSPSSAIFARFLRDRKPGTDILPYLPCELIQLISVCLPMDRLGDFRLTCTQLESKLFQYFVKTYFRELKIRPSLFGLQAPVDISQSRIAPYVRFLALGPVYNDQGATTLGHIRPLIVALREKILSKLQLDAENNRRMRLLNQDSELIKEALKNLRGITKIVFLDQRCDDGDWESSYPYWESFVMKEDYRWSIFEKRPLDATQSMARLFNLTLSAAGSVGLASECIDAHMTNRIALEPIYDPDCAGFAALPLDFPVSIEMDEEPRISSFKCFTTLKIFIGCPHDVENETGR